ncbi:MAG: zeta toxin family protein [Puniceicoccales bacterium]|jgi:predicted ABC-type ATPase|nr:zeta toxin family protein [Puniceicoccales bacterium]
MPLCIIIGGPNGAGKTTFAQQYLPKEAGVLRFINTDEIARGLSPFAPELASRSASRIAIHEMRQACEAGVNFAIESTLSGRTHVVFIRQWKAVGYKIELAYLKVDVPELSVMRVAARVQQGGHSVPAEVIRRRVTRSWDNFNNLYRKLADDWWVFDASTQEMLDARIRGSKFTGWKV